jgi:hypothetical protein
MKCTPELLEKIKEAIESVRYGSVTISMSEAGSFVGIKTERLERVCKDEIFKKSEFKNG